METRQLLIPRIPATLLTTKSNTERLKAASKELSSNGIKFDLSYGPVLPHGEGCRKNHMQALAKIERFPHAIYEDDVIFTNKFKPIIDIPRDADAMYLGTSAWGLKMGWAKRRGTYGEATGLPGILRVKNMLGGHAIVYLSRAHRDALLHDLEHFADKNHRQVDVSMARIQKRWNIYSVQKPMIRQRNMPATKYIIPTPDGTRN